jgi:protein TonB
MSGSLDFQSPLRSDPLWRQLFRELRDRIRPQPEPELALESKPIPVKDIWSREHNLKQRIGSIAIHAAIIGILMLPFWQPVRTAVKRQTEILVPTLFAPGPSLPKMKRLAGGGAPMHKVAPPKLIPVNAPKPLVAPPIELMPATAQANIPLPSFGDPGRMAGPPGTTAGHSGAGPGGLGMSANGGGNCLTGACGHGGDVTEPVPIYEPDPQYSNAARKAKFQGTVIVAVVIGVDGHVYNPRILRPLGLGLDQKALEAVKLWRFEPARRNGQPVQVAADIEVNFHLY